MPSKPEARVTAPTLLAELRSIAQWQRWTLLVVAALGAHLLFRR